MIKSLITFWSLLILFALPALAYAKGGPINPPNWLGRTMFFLALLLPIAVGLWVRNRKQY